MDTEDVTASWTRVKRHCLETEKEQETGGQTADREEDQQLEQETKKVQRTEKKREKKSKTRRPDNRPGQCLSCLAHPGSSLALLVVAAGMDNLPVAINNSSSSSINSNTNLQLPSLVPASLRPWPPLHHYPTARPLTSTGTARARWHQGGRLLVPHRGDPK